MDGGKPRPYNTKKVPRRWDFFIYQQATGFLAAYFTPVARLLLYLVEQHHFLLEGIGHPFLAISRPELLLPSSWRSLSISELLLPFLAIVQVI